MAGTNLNFPYDAEIFNYTWKNTPDLILTSMLESGAVVRDSEIARLIANGSNYFVTPYYDIIGGTEDVYNGVADFTADTLSGGTYAGVVYGRMHSWTAKSFIRDFNSGADPMAQIVAGVSQYWIKKRQERLIGILNALFGITGDADWLKHMTDVSSAGLAQSRIFTVTGGDVSAANATVTVTAVGLTGSPKAVTVGLLTTDDDAAKVAIKIRAALEADAAVGAFFDIGGATDKVILTVKTIAKYDSTMKAVFGAGTTGATAGADSDNTVAVEIVAGNLISATSVNDACVKANGDNAGNYSLVIAHSVVANRLANLQLLEYSKYTDASGIQRALPIGTINGKTLIVNDNVPVIGSPVEGESEYTTYVLGNGAIGYAEAPVDVPSEMDRDAKTNGGIDMIYTRLRECFAPNGFSFKGDVTTDVGVPDAVLLASASWERKMPAKSVFMAKLVTNG